MRTGHSTPSDPRPGRRGLSLVETTISILLVGVAFAAALNTVGAVRLAQRKVVDAGRGELLAESLMSEILAQTYADREAGEDSYGLEADEVGDGSRLRWDDVDDYSNFQDGAGLPRDKDGVPIDNLDGWHRSVSVAWVDPSNVSQTVVANQGAKRITVEVRYHDALAARLVAIRTVGLPDVEANAVRVLLVVTSENSPTAQEVARRALLESWSFRVQLIAANASQAAFNEAAANNDVAFVNEEILSTNLGTKLKWTSIGVVTELLQDMFGIATQYGSRTRNCIQITDNSHYITSPFSTGNLVFLTSDQPLTAIEGGAAPGMNTLANVFDYRYYFHDYYKPSLATINTGGALAGGGVANGRRVQLPWGNDAFNFNALNDDGKTLLKRALEWAGSREESGG